MTIGSLEASRRKYGFTVRFKTLKIFSISFIFILHLKNNLLLARYRTLANMLEAY